MLVYLYIVLYATTIILRHLFRSTLAYTCSTALRTRELQTWSAYRGQDRVRPPFQSKSTASAPSSRPRSTEGRRECPFDSKWTRTQSWMTRNSTPTFSTELSASSRCSRSVHSHYGVIEVASLFSSCNHIDINHYISAIANQIHLL